MPARNEEGNVGTAVVAARAAAERFAEKVEVIVVDDGSIDRTIEEARGAGADVISHGRNRGYGAALRTAFGAAGCPWIFLTDSDNQFDPEQLADLVAFAGQAEMIVGFRAQRADPAHRVWAGRAWNLLCHLAFGYLGRDIDCAFKLLDADFLRGLDLSCSGAAISAEIFTASRRCGARIVEVPVRHYPRRQGEASGLRPAVVGRAVKELWSLRRKSRRRS
jgi:glycosyltransferase involved in cell wall biosynthesis